MFPTLVGPAGPPGGNWFVVQTMALFRLIDPTAFPQNQLVWLLGYSAPNDGGGGLFMYDSGGTDADNGGTIIEPTVGPGQWNRQYSGAASVKWFGAKGDGVTSDTAAVQLCVDAVDNIFFEDGTFIFGNTNSSGAVFVMGSNKKIDGSNNTLIKHSAGTKTGALFLVGGNGVAFSAITDITFQNLGFEGNADGVGVVNTPTAINVVADTGYTRDTGGCRNITVSRCRFLGGFIYSVIGTGVNGFEMSDCYSTGNVFYPALVAGGYGFIPQTCWNVECLRNLFVADVDDRHAIYISCDPTLVGNAQCEDVLIQGNIIDWTGTSGVTHFEAACVFRACKNLLFTGNDITGGYSGIDMHAQVSNGDGDRVIVSDNVIQGIVANTSERACVNITTDGTANWSNVSICDNILKASTSLVFGIVAVGDDITCLGNNIEVLGGSSGFKLFTTDRFRSAGNRINGAGGEYAFTFIGVNNDTRIGVYFPDGIAQLYNIVDAPTNPIFEFPRTAYITSDGLGAITVTDPQEIITSVASAAHGADITLSDVVTVTQDGFSFTPMGSTPTFYYARGNVGQVLAFGVTDMAGVFLPLAANARVVAITTFR